MTLLGQHTADELQDLVDAKDTIVSTLKREYDALAGAWQAKRPADDEDWRSDFERFSARYAKARKDARFALARASVTPLPGSAIPAEDEYEGILRALTVVRNGSYQKGDVQDLYNRLADFKGSSFAIPTAQPRATSDLDARYYATSGKVLKAADQTLDAAIERSQRAVAKSKLDNALPYALGALAVGVAFSLYQSKK